MNALEAMIRSLQELDTVFARARHARWFGGVCPQFIDDTTDEWQVCIPGAVHPLLLEPALDPLPKPPSVNALTIRPIKAFLGVRSFFCERFSTTHSIPRSTPRHRSTSPIRKRFRNGSSASSVFGTHNSKPCQRDCSHRCVFERSSIQVLFRSQYGRQNGELENVGSLCFDGKSRIVHSCRIRSNPCQHCCSNTMVR